MEIDVDLLFHPVGQGLFASGHLKRAGSDVTEFSWIYDCGSSSAGNLEIAAANRLAAHLGGSRPSIDLLVISHFDHDHISGIPHLLSTFDVKRIVIPLVPLWARLLVIMQHGTAMSTLEQDLLLDPVGTLSGTLGAVAPEEILVVPDSDDSNGPAPWQTSGPKDPTFEIQADRADRDLEGDENFGYRRGRNSNTKVSFLASSGRITVGNVWEFVPYNDAKSIRVAPRRLISDAHEIVQALLNARSDCTRWSLLYDLKSAYQEIFKNSRARNQLSLFIYGGAHPRMQRKRRSHNGWWRLYPDNPPLQNRRGVLYTGDGTLQPSKAWPRLERFMGRHRVGHLLAMQVMHHGSRSNWRPGLAAKIDPETGVFNADPFFRLHHPHPEVWDDYASCSVPILVDTRFPCHLTQRFR